MSSEVERMLGPEIYKRAKDLVEAAGPDFDWTPLKEAVDEMMKGAAKLQGIDFGALEQVFDEAAQATKVKPVKG